MRNRRRSHSLQPVNRAQIIDPNSPQPHSSVSTANLTQVLLQTNAQCPSPSPSPSSSSQAPSLERSPPVSRQTTSRPTRPPPPPPRPPPYTSSIFDHLDLSSHQAFPTTEDPWSSRQRLETIFRGIIPDPTNTRPRRSPLTFQPVRTVSENMELLDDVKKLIIRASELHQDIEVKLTRIQLMLLRQEFERQDQNKHF